MKALRELKKMFILSGLLVTATVQAQHADKRIEKMLNESRWFELEQELKTTPANSITPFVRQKAKAMTHYYFNRPDSACIVLADLLNNHQQELGDQTLTMAILMGVNLARLDQYADATGLIQDLCNQLAGFGMDSTQIAPYLTMVRQYRALAACGSVCQPLHPTGTYRFPMVIENEKDQHFLETTGSLNGKESRLVFDTGAGGNLITPELAEEYGLRILDKDVSVGGIGGIKEGYYALADTLRIRDMAWTNVPFYVIDSRTGHAEADRFNSKFKLPPVIGMSIMFRMQELQMDFANREFIVPAEPTPNPLPESNLLRTETECLQLKTTDETGNPLYFHFDTGSYYTNMQPSWYERHKNEVETAGIPDTLRVAGIGGASITRSYLMPQMKFRIGNGTAKLNSVNVNTGIDLHTGQSKVVAFSQGQEDGFLGLDLLERFSKVILNLKEMYLEAIPK